MDHTKPAKSAYAIPLCHLHSSLSTSDAETVNTPAPATNTQAITVRVDDSANKAIPKRGVRMAETLETTLVLEAPTEPMPK